MFRLTQPPEMPSFDAGDLTATGFKLVDGEVRSIETGEYFKYFHTDNERVNDERKEAIHEATRKEVAKALEKYDIKPLYAQGTSVSHDKPQGPHVSLLSTEVSKLRKKRDIIVVVGEAAAGQQDGGIWAYRILMREGGMQKGSAVGLASSVFSQGQAERTDDIESEIYKDGKGGYKLSQQDEARTVCGLPDDECLRSLAEGTNTPGVFILNPAQILYSPMENKPMTHMTWHARQRPHSLSDQYAISKTYNEVKGFETQDKHINRCFEHILPSLINEDTRIYIVAIGDSAESTVDYLDQVFLNKKGGGWPGTGLSKQLEAIALINTNHEHDDIASTHLQNFLAVNGRSWVESETIPAGNLVQMPKVLQPTFEDVSKEQEGDDGGDEEERRDSMMAPQPIRPVPGADHPPTPANTQVHSPVSDGSTDEISLTNTPTSDEDKFSDEEDMANDEPVAPSEVSCPTFSAGNHNGVKELVWPDVMGDVLEFFWMQKAQAEAREQLGGARLD